MLKLAHAVSSCTLRINTSLPAPKLHAACTIPIHTCWALQLLTYFLGLPATPHGGSGSRGGGGRGEGELCGLVDRQLQGLAGGDAVPVRVHRELGGPPMAAKKLLAHPCSPSPLPPWRTAGQL